MSHRRQRQVPARATARPLPPQRPTNAPAPRQGKRPPLPQREVAFPPGEPLAPVPGLTGPDGAPRQWAYPVGYNIAQRPRATEQSSFEQLRNLAALFDGVQLCERVYFDLLGRLELRVLPRAELLAAGESASAPHWRDPAQRIAAFLESPDRAQDLRAWLVAFVRDLLEIDAVAIFAHRTRGGGLHALELVSGDTIKPLIDELGRTPQPPLPAYQQFVYGVPGGWFSADELDYVRETARTDSVYGLSRVERIILRVNQALRKQDYDLARFTDGSTPLGVIEPPVDLVWTPEQVRVFEETFNGLLAGNDQYRVRARALPPGAKWHALTGDDPLMGFDRFLLNITVAAFGLTMDELGFTDTSNRSVGESQQSVVYRRAVAPVAALAAAHLTRAVRRWLDPRFTVSFAGIEEPEDFAVRAEALARLIPVGVISPSQAARLLRLPVEQEVPAYIMTHSGPVLVRELGNAGSLPNCPPAATSSATTSDR
ncbi:MAG TPA: phage portal protein [Ktedonobacterales bacterium]